MSNSPIQIRLVPTQPIFTDDHSGADMNVAIYEPILPDDSWYFLGHVAVTLPYGHHPMSDPLVAHQAPAALIVRSDDPSALAPVTPKTKLWTSEHSGLTQHIEIYSFAAQGNYVSLGLYASIVDQYGTPPQNSGMWNRLRAIRADLVNTNDYGNMNLDKVWKDSGSGAHGDGQWKNIQLWNGNFDFRQNMPLGIRPETFMMSDAYNSYNTPGSPDEFVPRFGLTIKRSAVQLPEHSTWMGDTEDIHPLKLSQICLPATHDSGTAGVANAMDFGNSFLEEVESKVLGILNHIPELDSHLMEEYVMPAIRNSATATHRTVLQQMMDGIRGFDLRVYYHHGDYYVGHGGLISFKLRDIFDDMRYFLSITSGEILYVTMGHWTGFNNSQYNDFADLLQNFFSGFAYQRPNWNSAPYIWRGSQNNSEALFDQIYSEITGQDKKSKIVLVYDVDPSQYPSLVNNNFFWGPSYSPPSSGIGENPPFKLPGVYGYYTATESVDDMIAAQKEQLRIAESGPYPFALYTTLTPSTPSTILRIILAVEQALHNHPLLNKILDKIIELVNDVFHIHLNIDDLYHPERVTWWSLEDLTRRVGDQFDTVMNNFIGDKGNKISLLYLDFYEKTNVVDLAISFSQMVHNGPVQLAPAFRDTSDTSYRLPYAFFRNQVPYHYKHGRVFLSSTEDGTGPVYTDDQVSIVVRNHTTGSEQSYVWDYSHGNSGQVIREAPTEITHLFGSGEHTVQIIMTDLYHNSKGSSGYYLVHQSR